MKRRNGNRHDRARYHQVSERLRYQRDKFYDWYDQSVPRNQIRQRLKTCSLDDDWDFDHGPNTMGKQGRDACRVPDIEYKNRIINLNTKDLHHQPQWVQHGHHRNLARKFRYPDIVRARYIYYQYEKVLAALRLAAANPDKLWLLEHYKSDYSQHPKFYGAPTAKIELTSIVLSDLDAWLRSQADPPKYHSTYSSTPGEPYEKQPRVYPHQYGVYLHICKTLRELGYNLYGE